MEFCKVALTFESVDEILWCDYANETSQSVLSHGATWFSTFYKMKFGIFYRILPLATFGSEGLLSYMFIVILTTVLLFFFPTLGSSSSQHATSNCDKS